MTENSLIPFSGGIDSFYAAYLELEEGRNVILTYIDLTNNDTKNQAEWKYRQKNVDVLRNAFGSDRIIDLGTVASVDLHIDDKDIDRWLRKYQVVQPVLWLMLSATSYTFSRLVMPFISGDTTISWRQELEDLDLALWALSDYSKYEMTWPLFKITKNEIVSAIVDLRETNRLPGEAKIKSVINSFWTCENPKKVSKIPDSRLFVVIEHKEHDDEIYVECENRCKKCLEKENLIQLSKNL